MKPAEPWRDAPAHCAVCGRYMAAQYAITAKPKCERCDRWAAELRCFGCGRTFLSTDRRSVRFCNPCRAGMGVES